MMLPRFPRCFTVRTHQAGPLLFGLLVACTLVACTPTPPDPQVLINQALVAHGADSLEGKLVTFDFRGRQFRMQHTGGRFQYERLYTTDTTGLVREVVNNDGFFRYIDAVPDSTADAEFLRRMETSVNSVAYFALLPYKLNDPAVIKTYLGSQTLEGEPYHKVEVRFQEEGGGRDFEDWFVYWFHQERHTMDYLSYYFFVDDEGSRFRRAINPRVIGGFRWQDYENYRAEPDTLGYAIEAYDLLFEAGGVTLLSEVMLENLQVTSLAP